MPQVSARAARRIGAGLLLLLVVAVAARAGAAYETATYRHVVVRFHAEGMETDSPLVQVLVNCVPQQTLNGLPTHQSVDLHQLSTSDLVTVQVRVGVDSYHLKFWLVVDGRALNGYESPGQFGNPTGFGSSTTLSTWLVARTYSASGHEVVHAGCGPHPAPDLLLNGPAPPDHGSLWMRSLAVAAWLSPWMLRLFLYTGFLLLLAGTAYKAAHSTPKRATGWIAVLVLGGVLLTAHQLIDALKSAWVDNAMALGVALLSAFAGVFWLRDDIVTALRKLERAAKRLPPREPAVAPQEPTEYFARQPGELSTSESDV